MTLDKAPRGPVFLLDDYWSPVLLAHPNLRKIGELMNPYAINAMQNPLNLTPVSSELDDMATPSQVFTRDKHNLDGYVMKCPVMYRNKLSFPCGQCTNCRINHKRVWIGRLMLEHASSMRSFFVTLTYNDDNLPWTNDDDSKQTLDPEHSRKWIKHLKNTQHGFNWFLVGEYGDESERPHYHACLFTDSSFDLQKALAWWEEKYGFTSASDITPQRIDYICGYTVKKLTKAGDPRLGGRFPEFKRNGRKLGDLYLRNVIEWYSHKKPAEFLENFGDCLPVFRIQSRTYPFSKYHLRRIRQALGIPATLAERRNNSRNQEICASYRDYFEDAPEWAEIDPIAIGNKYDQKKKFKKSIAQYQTI